jgi:glycosyltransferase involved in cell wall biosynthesis
MLLPDPRVKGSMAQLGQQLLDALSRLGMSMDARRWGRHSDSEGPFRSLWGRFVDALRIRRALRLGGYDLLVIHSAHDRRALIRDVVLVLLTRGLCKRRIIQFHGSLANELSGEGGRLFAAGSRWLVRQLDCVLLLSSEEADDWRRFEPSATYEVATNCYVSKPALRRGREHGEARSTPTVLFVGRLIRGKGVFDLLEAMTRIKEAGVEFRLMLVGDGEHREELAASLEGSDLASNVIMTGHLSGEALAKAYREADMFVLPSHSEGFPTVLSEAMDAGLPIVTTGIRGALDHLVEGENALFCPPGRPDLLATAVLSVLTDADLREKMSRNNRAKVAEFAPAVVATLYEEIFERVLLETAGDAR